MLTMSSLCYPSELGSWLKACHVLDLLTSEDGKCTSGIDDEDKLISTSNSREIPHIQELDCEILGVKY